MRNGIFAVFALVLCGSAQAQSDDISMASIIADAERYVQVVEHEYGQQIVRMELDLISSTKEAFRTLSGGLEYGIAAFGDQNIKDIDLKIYKFVNDQWVLIEKDNKREKFAMVTVRPEVTAQYMIEISAYEFAENKHVGHYGLMIFHP
jgi:hypothetical protein